MEFIKKNKKIIIQLLLLVLIYKFILTIAGFLFHYYTFKVEMFNFSSLLAIWNQWDAGVYLNIAKSGYNPLDITIRYFPLFPMLVGILGKMLGYGLAAYTINTIALLVFLFGLYHLVKIDYDEEDSWRAILYYLIFPTAVFLTAFYTESIFLALAVWCFYFTRKRNWLIAGILGFFAATSRIEGSVLFIFMLYEFLQGIKFDLKKINFNIIYSFLPLFGTIAFGTYLYLSFGDFFLFLKGHDLAGNRINMPWESVGEYLAIFLRFDILSSPYYLSHAVDLIFFIIGIALGVFMIFKSRISYALYTIFSVLMITFTGSLASTNRYALKIIPIVILLAKYGRNIIFNFFIIILFGNLFSLFFIRYIFGLWAG